VRLWVLEPEVVEQVRTEGENRTYLPDVHVPKSVSASTDVAEVVEGAEVVVSVSPSQHVGEVMSRAAPHMSDDVLVVSASKGIELSTLRRMSQVLASVLTESQMGGFTALSGPSFAAEVARESPTAVAVASESEQARIRVQHLFQTEYFRPYTNPDVVGVELGGSLKNVVALGAGVVSGLGFGHNTLAALITRGLAEIHRLGLAMGARPATFAGLAGMGDLVLTCTGDLSRNRTVGYKLGQGRELDDILDEMSSVAEGVETSRAAYRLAAEHGVEMPITEEVYAILHEGRSPEEAVRSLMLRDPKPEEWG
ncbi:MAG: NAD(P)H-dependent glycerol-3-phosphate dehydrogenase, partial [Gemmatimonadota bacterium]